MSAIELIHTCAVCGAEESLDALLARSVEDDELRRLVADVVAVSVPLGKDVLRYLRLFKPAKQKLRVNKARVVLTELLLDMKRCFIERKGRRWAVTTEDWRAGFEAVFDASEKGVLRTPLDGSAYLYEVLLRRVNAGEAKAEASRENERKHAPAAMREQPDGYTPPRTPASQGLTGDEAALALPRVSGPVGPSKFALKEQARIAARMGRKTDSTEMPAEPDATKGTEA